MKYNFQSERSIFFLKMPISLANLVFLNQEPFSPEESELPTDTLGRSEQVPILGGARMSGKLNEKLANRRFEYAN